MAVGAAVLAVGVHAAPLVGPGLAQSAPTDIVGVWIDHTNQGAVEFYLCGERLCGRIAWIKEPFDAKGRPMTDSQNSDRAKRNRPMCGLQLVGDLARTANNAFENGWIYNPDDGDTYSVEVRLASPNVLLVHGYLGMKILGETFTWRRAPGTLQRCKA